MKANTSQESSPASTPAPDTTRPKALYLLLAATVPAGLQIPFAAALVPGGARSGTPTSDAAGNAVVTILLAYVMIRLGFRASRRVGFGTLKLTGWDDGNFRPAAARRTLLLATGIGVAVGLAVLIGLGLMSRYLPLGNAKEPAPWMGLLASLSAGVTEEILFRLGLMTSLAWLLTVLMRCPVAGPLIALVANVLAALVFAAAHLPQAKEFYGLSTLMVLVVMIGNGVPGVIFGWLFLRFGLIAAMVAHFSADVVLHVIGPIIG
jgi:membrane protease YdiL (CAAX protease family)